ncbi:MULTISPECIES: nucleotidyltransferase [Bacillus]|uniref:nucleotidyltransferase n=1 Tax=Bacillus TaxID=1386 RepID=UPI00166287D5|nr:MULTISPECIES: nucleotidyltransferase [Bacillus]MBV7320767.1 nucleotidyltransferase [Halalkalibacterium halodurans]MCP9299578.1 nucleotidyltransferase [Bacillus halotolerans]MCV0024713.1 nucleotidyltransferase [Bacillus sp. XT-2]MEC3638396.1 nucleotidyltransferase [Bacillus halotolerans]QNS21852.1 nucleotidyltransferase [Bacillus halotolerans]
MKAVGLVVEYNPFHNGHLYHAQTAKRQTGCDTAVAVMSGHFLQRGEPAVVSKWARTKMALQSGVDLVIELPYLYAVQKAEIFAHGSVSTLNKLGCEALFFGSENGQIEPFLETAKVMDEHKDSFDQCIKEELKKGASYPSAAAIAFKSILHTENGLDMSKPNNILGYNYVKSILSGGYEMKPYTTSRISSDYHDADLPDEDSHIASATSIRKALIEKPFEDCVTFLPAAAARELANYRKSFGLWHTPESYFSYLKYSLSTLTALELQQIYEVEEGLENRILRSIRKASSYQEFMEFLKTKRYTWTRLQRMSTHILTRTKKQEIHRLLNVEEVPYIRLLGMTKKGQAFLSEKKKELSVPLVSKLASFSHPALDLDIKASRIYSLAIEEPLRTEFDLQEYGHAPIRYDEDEHRFLSI